MEGFKEVGAGVWVRQTERRPEHLGAQAKRRAEKSRQYQKVANEIIEAYQQGEEIDFNALSTFLLLGGEHVDPTLQAILPDGKTFTNWSEVADHLGIEDESERASFLQTTDRFRSVEEIINKDNP